MTRLAAFAAAALGWALLAGCNDLSSPPSDPAPDHSGTLPASPSPSAQSPAQSKIPSIPPGSEPAPIDVGPSDLPRGPDPALPYYNTVTHEFVVGGDHWRVDFTGEVSEVAYAGHRRFLVKTLPYTLSWLDGTDVRVLTDRALGFWTSGDRSIVVVSQVGGLRVTALDPTSGKVIAEKSHADVVATLGNRFVVVKGHGSYLWNPRTNRTVPFTRSHVRSVNHSSGRVVLWDVCYGVVPLDDPKAWLWKVCSRINYWEPGELSPYGRHLIAYKASLRRPTSAVLDASSGQFEAVFRMPGQNWTIWESATTVLLDVVSHRNMVVVRCTIAGRCERASDPYPMTFDPEFGYPIPPLKFSQR